MDISMLKSRMSVETNIPNTPLRKDVRPLQILIAPQQIFEALQAVDAWDVYCSDPLYLVIGLRYRPMKNLTRKVLCCFCR